MAVNLVDSSNIKVNQAGDDISLDFSTTGAIGDLTTLTTTDKSSLVGAINELDSNNIEEMYNPGGVGNGYIKFKNGLIYEWKFLQVTTTSSTYGPLWYSDHSLGNWAVPILEFISFGSSVNNYNYWATLNSMGNNSAGTIRLYRANNVSGTSVYISVWAFGTWK